MRVTRQSDVASGVRARFGDVGGARRAIEALQFGGVEASAISISGDGAEAALRVANSRLDSSGSDNPVMWRVAWRGFWWSVAGAIAGAAVGTLLGLTGIGIPGTSNGLVIQIVCWTMFLHVLGAIIGVYAGISSGTAWEQTFLPVEGAVVVEVRSRDARTLERAARIMREKGGAAVV